MRYLALDQALRTTGWAFFIDDKLSKQGHFTIPEKEDIENRLGKFWSYLTEWYHDLEFDMLFFEDIQQQHGNVTTYKKLAYVQAAIMLWCYFNEIPYQVLSPSEWRKILKDKYGQGFGRSRVEQKKTAQELIEKLYNFDATEDEADAICLGLAGVLKYGKRKSAF